jgi:ABC-type uncharacterized transport system ATPase subunit
MAEMMVGSSFAEDPEPRKPARPARWCWRSRARLPAPRPSAPRCKNITFRCAGEVLGIGGVAGNGQDELLAALSGERARARRRDQLNGAHRPAGPERAARLGLLPRPRNGWATPPPPT